MLASSAGQGKGVPDFLPDLYMHIGDTSWRDFSGVYVVGNGMDNYNLLGHISLTRSLLT